MSEPRTDPPGTVYGARRPARLGLPQDPLMRIALGVAVVGVLLGVLFATGVLGGGGGEPVVPAAAVPTPAASGSSAATPPPTAAPTTAAAPSPSAAPTTPAAPAAGPKVFRGVPSGRCLGVTGDDPEGAHAALADCTGGPEQQWVATPVSADVFTLVNAASGKCAQVDDAGTEAGDKLEQAPCTGAAEQQWAAG